MANTLKGLYIGGQWVRTATQFDDLNPSDGSVLGHRPKRLTNRNRHGDWGRAGGFSKMGGVAVPRAVSFHD